MQKQTKITEYATPTPHTSHNTFSANEPPTEAVKGSDKVVIGSDDLSSSTSDEPITTLTLCNNNNTNNRTRSVRTIMSGHHIRYIARYSGSQPFDNEARIVQLRGWRKYVWSRQNYKIIANRRSIEVTLEFEHGDRVKEKLDYCQDTVDRIGRVFGARHGLIYETPFTLTGHSHWVVEHRPTGDRLKSLVEKPKNNRVGAVYGDSSHPDKLELIGPESEKGAEGMDGLLIDLPNMINAWNQGQIRYMQEMKVLMGAIGQSISLQNRLIEILEKGGR